MLQFFLFSYVAIVLFFFFFGILLTFNANFYHSWESIYFLKSTMSQWCLIKKKKKKGNRHYSFSVQKLQTLLPFPVAFYFSLRHPHTVIVSILVMTQRWQNQLRMYKLPLYLSLYLFPWFSYVAYFAGAIRHSRFLLLSLTESFSLETSLPTVFFAFLTCFKLLVYIKKCSAFLWFISADLGTMLIAKLWLSVYRAKECVGSICLCEEGVQEPVIRILLTLCLRLKY